MDNPLLKLRPDNNNVWIQGFDLPEGREHVPVLVYNTAKDLGINFGSGHIKVRKLPVLKEQLIISLCGSRFIIYLTSRKKK
jgi:hypothetical protein